jgi:hypothetical protein
MNQINNRVDEAYEAAAALSGKTYGSVSFEVDGIKYTVRPMRLARKVHDLQKELDAMKKEKFQAVQSMKDSRPLKGMIYDNQ